MAETLDVSTMLAHQFEPKRKFRWILQIDGIDAYYLKTAARPQQTFDETVVDYINAKWYVAGKNTWSPMQVTTHDPISPSAATKVNDWLRRCYEPLTGRMGYMSQYKQNVSLKLLGPDGLVTELWDLVGAWAQDVNFGDLDYATSDNVEISFTLRFDTALLQYS
jgi:hypothetical protein